MDIRFYNSLNNAVEPFRTVESNKVRMYSCGPTVYDFAHIGNFRSFLFADFIRRFLEVAGYDVTHVCNITDVGHMTDDSVADGAGEDKMATAATRIKEDKKSGKVPEGAIENPDDPYQVAKYYTDAFLNDARQLGMKVAFEEETNILRATEHIPDMLTMIEELLSKNVAYRVGDVVYFSVESFSDYGKLSGNTLEKLQAGMGGRVSDDELAGKRHPGDFLLWKADPRHIMKWDSPYGEGYPGWHIECSVMARKLLGDVIDIHTGGEDLIFPHHECEIAQSRCATGADSFANFWMHARFLMVEGEKMSKSKGNFYTVRDVLSGKATGREVHPAVLRYELTKSHYRANMNFTHKGLTDSAANVKKLIDLRQKLSSEANGNAAEVDNSHPVLNDFLGALADDLNISGALGVLFPWVTSEHRNPAESLAVLDKINHVLSIAPIDVPASFREPEASTPGAESSFDPTALCRQIDEARATKDWATADKIRDELQSAGYAVKNSPEGTVAEKQLA
ncbi:cysteine--tRNA ligase [Stratiformator vulcanicus]|uniref:Cysteine--tRNA ligase n=1 Tax=Stratiformator vulcanicus TaxID=2527980 RepID=A0A517QXP3_9PLAN|nr:cysteine--tRNA ligase [Stratiformator vulcanicus]QDT36358.1 Cysteine--tRNA ligase [Stratiformator vulcanicus]